MRRFVSAWLLAACLPVSIVYAQNDSTQVEEDYSQYENAAFADSATKRYCTSKILDQLPQKLITVGYDMQGASTLDAGLFNTGPFYTPQSISMSQVQGLRLAANVPVISRNSGIWQLGFNYAQSQYSISEAGQLQHPLGYWLGKYGLRTAGLHTTVFKPLNEQRFLIFQAQVDLSGDYGWDNIQSLKYLRYSASAIYGWKKSDRLMYGFGLSRTYRVGDINYIPVILYNYTAPSRKWGVETVFPARLAVKRIFSPRSMLSWGHELEGQSYRLNNAGDISMRYDNLELRRGELRIRFMYDCSLYRFLWLSVQAGYRHNWSYDVDHLPKGNEFFRGFFGTQPFAIENKLSNTWYAQVSINLVSP